MSVSKPLYSFLGFYFENLFNNPIRTKSITSSIIASLGAFTSQKIAGGDIKYLAIVSYALFGLIFGGTVPHYFYQAIERAVPDVRYKRLLEFILERLTFAPVFTALSLYFLSIFELKGHAQAYKNLTQMYIGVLQANWRYLSLPVFINFNYVPNMLRVFGANFIGFCWIIYLADRRRRMAEKEKK